MISDLYSIEPSQSAGLSGEEAGGLELNRNPGHSFVEVEQSVFGPSNLVPGISWSPDKMLQARIFSYADSHRHRVGTHYNMLPVNRRSVAWRSKATKKLLLFCSNTARTLMPITAAA